MACITKEDPAGNIDGCPDENGKRREIGETWIGIGKWTGKANFRWLVSN